MGENVMHQGLFKPTSLTFLGIRVWKLRFKDRYHYKGVKGFENK